jgi:NitT/TauT family transport system substrate-binding protein
MNITNIQSSNTIDKSETTMNANRFGKAMKRWMAGALVTMAAFCSISANAAQPLTIGYSDWPGWVAWQVAIDKGWFKDAGVDVKFQWFDYSASMDAFAARMPVLT